MDGRLDAADAPMRKGMLSCFALLARNAPNRSADAPPVQPSLLGIAMASTPDRLGSMTQAEPLPSKPAASRSGALAALTVPTALGLIAVALLAGPVLWEQAAHLELSVPAGPAGSWSRWRTGGASQRPFWRRQWASQEGQQQAAERKAEAADGEAGDAPDVVSSAGEWERRPEAAFLAPTSRCLISTDGSVTRGPPPAAGQLPFLFNITGPSVPSRQEACGHCPNMRPEDKCKGPHMPYRCCGMCQFDGRVCERLYKGERRVESMLEDLGRRGFDFQEFTPCELFQRIRGRTLWLMGDSQAWQWYHAVECFLREFALSLQRSDPVPQHLMARLSTARQGFCHSWWPVPPHCMRLAHGTRVCIVRVDLAGEMAETALPTLVESVPGFSRDLLVVNSGLHYFEFDGPALCTNTTCKAPGPDSRFLRELRQLAAFRRAAAGQLPPTVWADTAPQHFPGTGYYVGEFHASGCVPWKAWEAGEALPRAGGMWNAAAAPLVPELADAHLRTWEPTVLLHSTHIPSECTHFCHASAYHVWLFMLNRLLHQQPGLASPVEVRRAAAAAAAEAAAPG